MEWVQFAEQFLAELSGGEEVKETQLRVGSGRKREKMISEAHVLTVRARLFFRWA